MDRLHFFHEAAFTPVLQTASPPPLLFLPRLARPVRFDCHADLFSANKNLLSSLVHRSAGGTNSAIKRKSIMGCEEPMRFRPLP